MAGRKQVQFISAATPRQKPLAAYREAAPTFQGICEMVKATAAAQRQREQLAELARAAIECGAPVRRIERGVSGVPEKELRAERKGQRPSIKKDMSRGMKNIFCSAAES
jgi:hypothetical protein